MYGDVVHGIKASDTHEDPFEAELARLRKANGAERDDQLDAKALKLCVDAFKRIFRERVGHEFPQNVRQQLRESIDSVFKSWNNARAIAYRKLNRIPGDWVRATKHFFFCQFERIFRFSFCCLTGYGLQCSSDGLWQFK